MNKRNITKVALAFALIIACSLTAFANLLPSNQIKREEWTLNSSYGFPVWIASNYVVDAMAGSFRRIFVFIEPSDFTKENAIKALTGLAAEYANPYEVWIYAYSNRDVVQQAADKSGGMLCVTFADGPEGRRASRNFSIRTELPKSGHFRASYIRFSDRKREELRYSPSAEQEHLVEIDLRNPGPKYSGDPNEDLVQAAEVGDVEKASALLEQAADINTRGKFGMTALMIAAWKGKTEIAKLLVEKGAEVNLKTDSGSTALMYAAIDGAADIVEILLNNGADINVRTSSEKGGLGDTALMWAALHGHTKVVQSLIARGAKIDERNRFRETALMQAALAGSSEVVRFLIDVGADVNARDNDGMTALLLAHNNKETVETLLKAGADFKIKNKEGLTALVTALKSFDDVKAQTLIENGAGKESIEVCKAYIAANPKEGDRGGNFKKEEGYRILTKIYLKLGLNKEAIETSKEAINVLGDRAHLNFRLGDTYLATGDRQSALKVYEYLKSRYKSAKDRDTNRLWKDWADALMERLNDR